MPILLKYVIFRSICYYSNKCGMHPADAIRNIRNAFPDSSVSDSTLFRYCSEIQNISQILPTDPAPSTKTDQDLLTEIKSFISQNETVSTRSLSKSLHVSNATIARYIQKSGFSYKRFELIPHPLDNHLRTLRMNHAIVMSEILKILGRVDYFPIITTDETWLLFHYEPEGCYVPIGTPSHLKVRRNMQDDKQMYVPLITSSGVAFDWFVPRNATIDSALWIASVVKPVDAWWRNRWKQCSDEQKKEISACIREAIEVGSTIIRERNFVRIAPLDDSQQLHQSEQLCLSFRSRDLSSESVSTSQDPEDADSSESTDSAPDRIHHTETITTTQRAHYPQRASAVNSLKTIQGIPSSYFGDTSDDDYTPLPSSRRTKLTHTPTQRNTPSSSQTSEAVDTDSDLPVCFFHYDNAPAHNSFSSRKALQHTRLIRMPHPPYSPDLAICDFAYFGGLKTALSRSNLCANTLSELKEATTSYNSTLDKPQMMKIFQSWQQRLLYVAEHNGDYCPSQLPPTELTSISQHPHAPATPPIQFRESATSTHRGIVGLVNATSTFCYSNAILQCLLATCPLVNYSLSHCLYLQDLGLREEFYFTVMRFINDAWSAYKNPNPNPYTCVQQCEPIKSIHIPILDPSPISHFIDTHLSSSPGKQHDAAEAFECFWTELVCCLFHAFLLLSIPLDEIIVSHSEL